MKYFAILVIFGPYMHQFVELYLFEQFTRCWTNLHPPVNLFYGGCNLLNNKELNSIHMPYGKKKYYDLIRYKWTQYM
jgi:hypothetical protein